MSDWITNADSSAEGEDLKKQNKKEQIYRLKERFYCVR